MSTSSSEGGPSTPGEHLWTGQAADPRGSAERTPVERPLLRCGPRGRHPARLIAAHEAAFNSRRCAPISRALCVWTNSGDVQNHART
jgi:hypothetical protein